MPVIKRTIEEWKPDLIHVHDFKHIPELIQLKYFLARYNIPRFLSVHDMTTHPSMIKSACFNWFYILTFRRAYRGWNYVFTVNDVLKDTIINEAKIINISNIGNAIGPVPEIPYELIEPYKKLLSDNCYKILSVGNLRIKKGFDYLIRSVRILLDKGYPIQLIIVGNGVDRERLEGEISSLHLECNVIMTGDLNNAIVRNLYPFFDAFALASYSETFGIVYLEAMYAGIPVIGIKGQGIDGVVKHEVNGILANPQDDMDLANKIEYLINNREHAQEMSHKGEMLVKTEFQLSILIKKIVSIYEHGK